MATNNQLKYQQIQKIQKSNGQGGKFMVTIYHFLYHSQLIIINIMSQSKKKRREKPKSESSNSDSDDSSLEEEQDSFIVGDDEDYSDDEGSYLRPRHDDDFQSKKKSKKKKKKKEKQRKKKNRFQDQYDFDDEDLDVVEEYEENNNFKRLKKNKQPRKIDNDYSDDEEFEEDMQDMDKEDLGGEDQGVYPQDGYYEKEEFSGPNEVEEREDVDLNDLFDPKIIGKYYRQPKDQEIVNFDIPERQFLKYMNYAKTTKVSTDKIKEQCQSEDRYYEAKWIFEKLRSQGLFEMYDEKATREKIYNVLVALHKDHLEIMYIYYYRKKIWGDILNLGLLHKIQEADEEWFGFKKQQQRLKNEVITFIQSFQEVPAGVEDLLKDCTEMKTLRYIKDYADFTVAKHKPDLQIKSSNRKLNIIKQICEKRISDWLQKNQVFLSPQLLCHNFRYRTQEKKPKTPQIQPDKVLNSLLKYNDPEEERQDMKRYPLLVQSKRVLTLCQYLAMELFNYPELRKILKQKYYKKLLISTNPTPKGQQNINLYSMYFPVKRIKDKPVASLKKQVWILATQAQKLGLITIDMKFQWELVLEGKKNFQNDSIYLEMGRYYFDLSTHSSGQVWNVFRKQVLIRMLTDDFFPAFMRQVKDQLTREGHKEIIEQACQKFRNQLSKGPSLKEGKPIKILSMVMEKDNFGMVFINEEGQYHFPFKLKIVNDQDIKNFVSHQSLYKYIEENKPDMILISANCRRAQTLRKQLRNPTLFPQSIYCAFGEYQIPSIMANKNIIQGVSQEKTILQAISMARLKKNPMAQILGLWSQNVQENAVLSINLHPLQKCVNKRRLMEALEKVAIEVVNLVGIDFANLAVSDNLANQLQFVCGLGPRKAFSLLEKVKEEKIVNRASLLGMVSGKYVYQNCSPFFKIQTSNHTHLLERVEKNKHGKRKDQEEINLLDMTRIPQEWYGIAEKLFTKAIRASNLLELKQKKCYQSFPDELISVIQMFKNPEKLRTIEWQDRKEQNNVFFDEILIKSEIMNRFKNPRDPERVMDNRDIFYNLLKETPETLKKYMVSTVKIISVSQQYLNVVIPENGLFGNIKIYETKPEYEKGNFIKAIITGFPFDEKRSRQRGDDDQQLLKVQMSLNFPHKTDQRNHDCFATCFPAIVREIHPLIDLEKDNFDLKKEDKPVIQVKEEIIRPRNDFRRISHPKFKNISLGTAIQEVKLLKIGDYIIRPSTEGNEFLTITWHFYKNVIAHIKLKMQQKSLTSANYIYRILDKDRDKIYQNLDEVIEKHINPMNALVQDVISNKKFLPLTIEQIEDKVKAEMNKDPSHIQYFFGASAEYPQFFIIVYMYKEKKPTKELLKIRNSGISFHDEQFPSLRELIVWFKEHLKERQYQRYAKNTAIKK